MERRHSSHFILWKVPVNKKENDGIKLNGIIIAINQAKPIRAATRRCWLRKANTNNYGKYAQN